MRQRLFEGMGKITGISVLNLPIKFRRKKIFFPNYINELDDTEGWPYNLALLIFQLIQAFEIPGSVLLLNLSFFMKCLLKTNLLKKFCKGRSAIQLPKRFIGADNFGFKTVPEKIRHPSILWYNRSHLLLISSYHALKRDNSFH